MDISLGMLITDHTSTLGPAARLSSRGGKEPLPIHLPARCEKLPKLAMLVL